MGFWLLLESPTIRQGSKILCRAEGLVTFGQAGASWSAPAPQGPTTAPASVSVYNPGLKLHFVSREHCSFDFPALALSSPTRSADIDGRPTLCQALYWPCIGDTKMKKQGLPALPALVPLSHFTASGPPFTPAAVPAALGPPARGGPPAPEAQLSLCPPSAPFALTPGT